MVVLGTVMYNVRGKKQSVTRAAMVSRGCGRTDRESCFVRSMLFGKVQTDVFVGVQLHAFVLREPKDICDRHQRQSCYRLQFIIVLDSNSMRLRSG